MSEHGEVVFLNGRQNEVMRGVSVLVAAGDNLMCRLHGTPAFGNFLIEGSQVGESVTFADIKWSPSGFDSLIEGLRQAKAEWEKITGTES